MTVREDLGFELTKDRSRKGEAQGGRGRERRGCRSRSSGLPPSPPLGPQEATGRHFNSTVLVVVGLPRLRSFRPSAFLPSRSSAGCGEQGPMGPGSSRQFYLQFVST